MPPTPEAVGTVLRESLATGGSRPRRLNIYWTTEDTVCVKQRNVEHGSTTTMHLYSLRRTTYG